MTKVKMDWKRLVLDMDGHAGSGIYGQDIVCAAESMLMQALLQTLIDMEQEKKLGMDWTGGPDMGFVHVEAAPAEEYRQEAEAVFRVTVTGLRMLAEEYKDYIELEEEK